jgi:hypothetical protein
MQWGYLERVWSTSVMAGQGVFLAGFTPVSAYNLKIIFLAL